METRVYLWAGLLILLFFICTKTLFIPTPFALLILGVVPGTTTNIPSWIILTIYPAICMLAASWLIRQSFFIGEKPSRLHKASVTKKTKSQQRAPKKSLARTKRRVRATT